MLEPDSPWRRIVSLRYGAKAGVAAVVGSLALGGVAAAATGTMPGPLRDVAHFLGAPSSVSAASESGEPHATESSSQKAEPKESESSATTGTTTPPTTGTTTTGHDHRHDPHPDHRSGPARPGRVRPVPRVRQQDLGQWGVRRPDRDPEPGRPQAGQPVGRLREPQGRRDLRRSSERQRLLHGRDREPRRADAPADAMADADVGHRRRPRPDRDHSHGPRHRARPGAPERERQRATAHSGDRSNGTATAAADRTTARASASGRWGNVMRASRGHNALLESTRGGVWPCSVLGRRDPAGQQRRVVRHRVLDQRQRDRAQLVVPRRRPHEADRPRVSAL